MLDRALVSDSLSNGLLVHALSSFHLPAYLYLIFDPLCPLDRLTKCLELLGHRLNHIYLLKNAAQHEVRILLSGPVDKTNADYPPRLARCSDLCHYEAYAVSWPFFSPHLKVTENCFRGRGSSSNRTVGFKIQPLRRIY